MITCVLSLASLVAMQDILFADKAIFTAGPGGIMGELFYSNVLKDSLGVFGSALILGVVYMLGMLFIFTRDIGVEFEKMLHAFTEWRAGGE